ncbi:MAG TPA: holo-ACP synthase [Syntrophobacteraceae bacterium]|nr:holo-ACP synthase [Syntrophobacteraceae bacterium]
MIRILQGIDIVAVSKIKSIMLSRPEFASEIFTDSEREYCFSRPNPYVHLAGRFAAKEAFLKALGTGLSGGGIDRALSEVEIVAEKSGRPALRLSGWTEKIGRRKKVYDCAVSISHSGDFAIASVILAARIPDEK